MPIPQYSKRYLDDQLLEADPTAPVLPFYMSFADGTRPRGSQFLGGLFIRAKSLTGAIVASHQQGLNPGGEVQAVLVKASVYESKVNALMEGAPQLFRELASHWEGMKAFNDTGTGSKRLGVYVDDFMFAIFPLGTQVWYRVDGQISDQRALELEQLDLASGLPQLVVRLLDIHYRSLKLVGDTEDSSDIAPASAPTLS